MTMGAYCHRYILCMQLPVLSTAILWTIPLNGAVPEVIQGANASKMLMPDGGSEPFKSYIYISEDSDVKILGVQGQVVLVHINPHTLALFLDHPDYPFWERKFREENRRAPSFAEMAESGLTIPLEEVADPQYFSFSYNFTFNDAQSIEGTWTLRIFDTLVDGISGFIEGWSLSLEVVPENPPALISWSPEDGSIIAGQDVVFSCSAEDPDGDPIGYRIGIYQDNMLVREVFRNRLEISTARGGMEEGIYRVEFLARDLSVNIRDYDVVSIHVMVDNTPLEWEYCYPAEGEIISGMVSVKSLITDRKRATYYYHISGMEAGRVGETVEEGAVFKDIFNTRILKDGLHSFFYLAVDQLGNHSASDDSLGCVRVLVDNSPPVIFFTAPLPGANITERDTVDFVISDLLSDIQSFDIIIDDELCDRVTLPAAGRTQEVSYPLPGELRSGYHTLTVRTLDFANNMETASLVFYLKPSF